MRGTEAARAGVIDVVVRDGHRVRETLHLQIVQTHQIEPARKVTDLDAFNLARTIYREYDIIYDKVRNALCPAANGGIGVTVALIDERFVDQAFYLKREVGKPEPVHVGPVVAPAFAFGSVIKGDDGELRMWYMSRRRLSVDLPGDEQRNRRQMSYELYATSSDGLSWNIPSLDLVGPVDGYRDIDPVPENAFLSGFMRDACGRQLCGRLGPESFCVLDARSTPHPHARGRYTALYYTWVKDERDETLGDKWKPGQSMDKGLCLAHSDDGVRWVAYPENPVSRNTSDANNVFFFDARLGKYVMFARLEVATTLEERATRAVARSESEDLIHWTPFRAVLDTDDRDADPFDYPDEGLERIRHGGDKTHIRRVRGRNRQFYGMMVFPYHSIYIGMAEVFDVGSGSAWLELCHSYDGENWLREAVPEPFFKPRPGDWDGVRIQPMMASPPITMGEELWFYHGGMDANHHRSDTYERRGIGVRSVLKDRFVGYRALKEKAGELITAPLPKPKTVLLNADVGASGEIRIEMLGPHGEQINGYRLDQCRAIRSSGTAAPVRFIDHETFDALPHSHIRMRIRLIGSTLYALYLTGLSEADRNDCRSALRS